MLAADNIDILLNYLLEESPGFGKLIIPSDTAGKRQLMRSLMNRRSPVQISEQILKVQDTKWYKSQDNYTKFISAIEGKSTVFLELVVGYNTPGIIRYPFEAMVHNNPNAILIRLNRDHHDGMSENIGSTISFNEDMTTVLDGVKRLAADIHI